MRHQVSVALSTDRPTFDFPRESFGDDIFIVSVFEAHFFESVPALARDRIVYVEFQADFNKVWIGREGSPDLRRTEIEIGASLSIQNVAGTWIESDSSV